MPKHAMSRSQKVARLKVIGTVVLVVAFVTLFVGGAVGLIGKPDDEPVDLSGVAPQATAPPSSTATQPSGSSSAAPTSPSAPASSPTDTTTPTPVVTGVPPQPVTGSKKLKRTLAWLRRGLADETTFKVATFNLLGNSHTASGGNRSSGGWASGTVRAGWAWSIVQQSGASVVGFQEMEDPQYSRIMGLSGWSAYPGPTLDRGSIRDSIFWNPSVWELVEANSISIPYFGGQMIRRPVVELKNIDSGREVWFFNTHNPATTPAHGNNARWRAEAISLEVKLANELSADGTPVVFTGDYNDRAEAFCPLVGGTSLEAANGGSNDGSCATPDHMDVDWLFGSGVEWSDYVSASQGITGRVTDHPFVYAQAYIPEEPLEGSSDDPSPSESPSAD